MEKIGNLFREARELKGMTQRELADRSRVNLRTIQRLENDENKPRLSTIRLLANELELEMETISDHTAAHGKGSIADFVVKGFFLLILNFVLMGIFGYLTLDSGANMNSRMGAILLSFLIPILIVFYTQEMRNLERTLKFGFGFLIYFILVMILHGFPLGFGSMLFPCLAIALATLYYGKNILRNQ